MGENSWYRIDRILSEKNEQKGTRVEKFYEVLWAPTWEPAKRIKAEAPSVVEEYEKMKQRNSSGRIPGKPSTKRTGMSNQIKILGVLGNNSRDVKNSSMILENIPSGERWCMQYEDVKKYHQSELIQFFEECICGFTK